MSRAVFPTHRMLPYFVLRAIMVRRKKTDNLNGQVLVELPARNIEIVTCDFDKEERTFYGNLEEKITSATEKVVQAGEMQKSYTHILVLLLRLRQGMIKPVFVLNNDQWSSQHAIIRP